MDPNRGFASNGQPGHRDEARTVLVTADYHPPSGKYQTNQLRAGDNIEQDPLSRPRTGEREEHQISDNGQLGGGRPPPGALLAKRTSGTLGGWLKQLNSCLFCLNVFLSVLNTLLISLLVKSVQQSGHNLLSQDGRLAWDEHSESLHLNLPVSLRSDRLLSVGSIESDQDGPLIIENVHTFDYGNEPYGSSSSRVVGSGGSRRPAGESASSPARGQILISARSEGSSAEANFIRVAAVSPSSSLSARSFGARSLKQPSRPVEIFANSLILNQLSDERRPAVTSKESRNTQNKGQGYTVHETGAASTRGDQLKRQSSAGPAQVNGRRLLELDGQRQTIVLPLLNKIDLFSSSGRTLFVKDELRCSGDISGRLDANLDIQTRQGNLSFRSGRTLRIVSRSDKLNLASTGKLTLEAPTLRLGTPQANKVVVSGGLEYVELEQKRPEGYEPSSAQHSLSTRPLEGFKLVLIDDILMAAPD